MDKSLLLFIAGGIGFIYFITSFIGDIQAEDEAYQNKEYSTKTLHEKYKKIDSIGQNILDFTNVPENIQLDVWKNSGLKMEFLELFPDFSEMKLFVNDRIIGDVLQNKLNQKLESIEDKFFSGNLTSEQAKRELSLLQ